MRTDYDCEYTKENARRTVNTANIVSNYAIALKHSDYNNYDNYSLSQSLIICLMFYFHFNFENPAHITYTNLEFSFQVYSSLAFSNLSALYVLKQMAIANLSAQ